MSEVTTKLIKNLSNRLFNQKIINNVERGYYVEELVLYALGKKWKCVSSGWHPWDFETMMGEKRIRIQVKQSAALQIWTTNKSSKKQFVTQIKKKPVYFNRDNPGVQIEEQGRFCEIYIFAWHGITSKSKCDQRIPEQWTFFIVTEKSLGKEKFITLKKLESSWLQKVGGRKSNWKSLKDSMISVIKTLN